MSQQDVGYRKTYTIRRSIPGSNSLEVTFPYEVVERESRRMEITVDEFINRFNVEAEFNSTPGVRYIFVEKNNKAAEEGG